MRWALRRWPRLEARDYTRLLALEGGFAIRELDVEAGDWVTGRPLDDLELMQEGILVLGVRRADGSYLGVPRGETEVRPGDQLVLYGRDRAIRGLDERRRDPRGDEAHAEGVSKTRRRREAQKAEEPGKGGS